MSPGILPVPAAAGFFHPDQPATTQILGSAAALWWQHQTPDRQAAWSAQAAAGGTTTVVLARGAPALSDAALAAHGLLVEHDPDSEDYELVAHRRSVQAWRHAPHLTLHGVFLSVLGLGVLLQGVSGAGKSELALDLIARGHRLVADDAVELRRIAPGVLMGESTPLLHGFMEARGLGVLDVRRCHGPDAVQARERLDLVIRLDTADRPVFSGEDRLRGRRSLRHLLDVDVPEISVSRGLGHNLAPLVETACRDHWLRLCGYAADTAFEIRQQAAIESTPA